MGSRKELRNKLRGNILIMVGLLFVFACTQSPRSDNVRGEENLEKPTRSLSSVEDIQHAYAEISSELEGGVLDSSMFEYSCHDEKKGTVSYFTNKGQLRLIVHRYNEYDHFSAVDQYFVKDSMLFFVNSTSTAWAFDGPEGSTRDNITEERVYLVDHQPVKCLEKKFVIRSQRTDNPSSETVPSKDVDCSSSDAVMKPYHLLSKYRDNPTSGCLE